MSQVEAPKYLKNGGFGDHFHHAGWPKVADIVIEAQSFMESLPPPIPFDPQGLVALFFLFIVLVFLGRVNDWEVLIIPLLVLAMIVLSYRNKISPSVPAQRPT
jgi:hypothetical protein